MSDRKRALAIGLPVLLFSVAVGGIISCKTRSFGEKEKSSGKEFQTRDLGASSFGLRDGEFVLTLDDGPAARSREVAEFLARENVPTTFFMVGQKARQRESVVKAISEMKLPNGKLAHIIANHSWTHEVDLGETSFGTVLEEVQNADDILKKYIKGTFFFRPPFGSLVAGGEGNINGLNRSGDLAKYIGPVLWNVGGAMNNGFAADWACWNLPNVTIQSCHDGYVREAVAERKGIILLHDIHDETIDMIMGTNGAPSLIRSLRSKGFKFVALDAYPDAVKRFGTFKSPVSLPGKGNISVTAVDSTTMQFKMSVPGAERLEVWVDQLNSPLKSNDGDSIEFTQTFSTLGSRTVTLRGFKNGELFSDDTIPFTVGQTPARPAAPNPGVDSRANAKVCPNLDDRPNVRDENLRVFEKANPGEPVVRSNQTKSDANGIVFEKVTFLLPPEGPGWIAKRFICDL
jgi:peptidoglycan/xylan/chitin deacetylase (PgdA/CDA1 family)